MTLPGDAHTLVHSLTLHIAVPPFLFRSCCVSIAASGLLCQKCYMSTADDGVSLVIHTPLHELTLAVTTCCVHHKAQNQVINRGSPHLSSTGDN